MLTFNLKNQWFDKIKNGENEKDMLIIDGQKVTSFDEQCEFGSSGENKNQILLLDFANYPCLLMCLNNGRVEVVAEIARGSENYKHFEHNKLKEVNSFSLR